jgi:hypothetical protein
MRHTGSYLFREGSNRSLAGVPFTGGIGSHHESSTTDPRALPDFDPALRSLAMAIGRRECPRYAITARPAC